MYYLVGSEEQADLARSLGQIAAGEQFAAGRAAWDQTEIVVLVAGTAEEEAEAQELILLAQQVVASVSVQVVDLRAS